MEGEKRSVHRKTLDYLLFHPEIFGIEKRDISASSSEAIIFSRGKTYGEVDVIYFLRPNERGVVVVEYKSNPQF